jgi:predicted DNA-binding transcriptional regulator AlpA
MPTLSQTQPNSRSRFNGLQPTRSTPAPCGAGKPSRGAIAYGVLRTAMLDRTAPVLLDPHEAIAALGISASAFDRRIKDGKLPLEDVMLAGKRELYRRDTLREVIPRRAGRSVCSRGTYK